MVLVEYTYTEINNKLTLAPTVSRLSHTSSSQGSAVKQGAHFHLLCRVCSRDTDRQSDMQFGLSLHSLFLPFFSLSFSLPPTQLSERPCLTPESTHSVKSYARVWQTQKYDTAVDPHYTRFIFFSN